MDRHGGRAIVLHMDGNDKAGDAERWDGDSRQGHWERTD